MSVDYVPESQSVSLAACEFVSHHPRAPVLWQLSGYPVGSDAFRWVMHLLFPLQWRRPARLRAVSAVHGELRLVLMTCSALLHSPTLQAVQASFMLPA